MSIGVSGLIKNFGAATVVHGISFDVAQGEFLSLLGPSGCGKTTTLRCIAGLENAQGGTITIDGETVLQPDSGLMVPAHDRHVGMVFQSYAIWPHFSVAENVGFPLSVRKVPKADIVRQVDDALAVVGLQHLKERQPSQLSGGQQQRVALARAIVGNPKVLLFDEPLSNLDAKLREGTRIEIRRLQRKLNVAAVYVTHDQEEALSMSDRVIVMESGRIMQVGTPKDLYRRPANRFVADFVGRASFIDVAPSANGGTWTTSSGATLHVDDADLPQAERYQAMLRPEGIDITSGSADQAAAPGINRLSGRIKDSQYLGAHTEYAVEAGGTTIRVHSRQDFEVGAPVTLTFTKDNCRLVAAEQPK
jgi:ABC-type Fe3+/spermidine/putrescine transport system ATPase subunit